MAVSFLSAKNGSETCSYNDIRLHSFYNPQKEAENFVAALTIDYNPDYILITEPGLSYTSEPLRKRYPSAKLIAIRYTHAFDKKNDNWDIVFYCDENNLSFENSFFNSLGEEGILNCVFLSWQPSEKAFEKQNTATWQAIKNAAKKSQAVLTTRSFFSQRWIKNICKFFSTINTTVSIEKGSSPVVIAASGPSLKSSIPFLKKYRKSFFLIAVSSAIKPLFFSGITPDLCLSTDGGYYAKRHLAFLKKYASIPLAVTAESACPSDLLEKNDILPLSYYDFPEHLFFEYLNIPSYKVFRNGTVSGTALQFAMSVTSGNIFFCGLDMEEAKGFQHTQPNELEVEQEIFDNRIKTESTRIASSGLPSKSLEIYRNWFSEQSEAFYTRVKRISFRYQYSNHLGKIEDCDWNDFKEEELQKPSLSQCKRLKSKKERMKRLNELLHTISESEEWLHTVFPADYICYKRSVLQSQKEKYKKSLAKKNEELVLKLQDITK